MCDCDVECTFQESRKRTARKPHRCTECQVLIAPGVEYHYRVFVVEQGYAHKEFQQAKVCLSCEKDWDTVTDAEFRNGGFMSACICYGELKQRIQRAREDGYLEGNAEIEMYLRWFTPEPEEVGIEPRLAPGGVYPSEAWRLQQLPF